LTKINKPLFSLSAFGTLGKNLVFRRRGKDTVAQRLAHPVDRRSVAQLQWRTMYQKAVALWHLLSPAEKEAWERQATPLHMIGFAYFVSQALKPNPGVYLPLSGGTMSGAVDFDGHEILNLPEPTDNLEPIRKLDLATHAACDSAIHALKGEVSFRAHQTSRQTITAGGYTTLQWHSCDWNVGNYFDLANNRFKPLVAGKYHFDVAVRFYNCSITCRFNLYAYRNGVLYAALDIKEVEDYNYPLLNGSHIVSFNGSTDYVQWKLYMTGIDALTHGTDAYNVWVEGHLIPQT